MIGNLWEWVDHWAPAGRDSGFSRAVIRFPWPGRYGEDATWNLDGEAVQGSGLWVTGAPAAAQRGGNWSSGTLSGAFALNLNDGPATSYPL